ncbi:MAG: tetratricopeptide repeat protein, partial [Planctomycetes bacterium]|nr:tetratricopeptide repeat protein [Planctomycetota bacterium]
MPAAGPPLTEQAAFGLARCAQTSGRATEAIPVLEALIREWPTAQSWNQLGLLHDGLGNLAAG